MVAPETEVFRRRRDLVRLCCLKVEDPEEAEGGAATERAPAPVPVPAAAVLAFRLVFRVVILSAASFDDFFEIDDEENILKEFKIKSVQNEAFQN